MLSRKMKALIWTIAAIIILTIAAYFWYTHSGYLTKDCAHLPADKQDACCSAQQKDSVSINCDGGWKFDRVLGECLFECNSNSSSQTPQKFCTADVKQCSDGSYVSRDPTNDCQFKPCPLIK